MLSPIRIFLCLAFMLVAINGVDAQQPEVLPLKPNGRLGHSLRFPNDITGIYRQPRHFVEGMNHLPAFDRIRPAKLEVFCPSDATLWINGQKTTSHGAYRLFQVGGLIECVDLPHLVVADLRKRIGQTENYETYRARAMINLQPGVGRQLRLYRHKFERVESGLPPQVVHKIMEAIQKGLDEKFKALERKAKARQKAKDLEDRFEDLKDEIEDLKDEIEDLDDEIKALKRKSKARPKSEDLEGKIENLEKEIKVLKGKIKILENRNKALTGKIKTLEDKNNALMKELNPLKRQAELLNISGPESEFAYVTTYLEYEPNPPATDRFRYVGSTPPHLCFHAIGKNWSSKNKTFKYDLQIMFDGTTTATSTVDGQVINGRTGFIKFATEAARLIDNAITQKLVAGGKLTGQIVVNARLRFDDRDVTLNRLLIITKKK